MAGHKGHEFVWVKNVDHQLRHEADSDEIACCGGRVGGRFARAFLQAKIAQTRSGTTLSHLLPDAACTLLAGNIMQIQ